MMRIDSNCLMNSSLEQLTHLDASMISLAYRRSLLQLTQMSRLVRKQTFCICKNKDADQIRGNREADQRLCFRYIVRTITLLSKPEMSSLWPSFVAVQPVFLFSLMSHSRLFHS